jgi:hypothetical protein
MIPGYIEDLMEGKIAGTQITQEMLLVSINVELNSMIDIYTERTGKILDVFISERREKREKTKFHYRKRPSSCFRNWLMNNSLLFSLNSQGKHLKYKIRS